MNLTNMLGGAVDKQRLRIEVDDLLRTMPSIDEIASDDQDILAWLGRVEAVLHAWDGIQSVGVTTAVSNLSPGFAQNVVGSYRQIVKLLHRASNSLRLETVGPLSAVMQKGEVFDYFDGVRKVIEAAKQDVLFVDRFLDAEFVSRYLPHITAGVNIRLLTRDKIAALNPAVQVFAQQHGQKIEVRESTQIHDRFVFVDACECYQSGASFKDGGKAAPVTLTQISDALPAMLKTYEDLWQSGKTVLRV
jgi:hypothetical protein